MLVWRTGDRVPQAKLVVGLPTNALDLPPAPGVCVTDDGVWEADVDTVEGAKLVAATQRPPILTDDDAAERHGDACATRMR